MQNSTNISNPRTLPPKQTQHFRREVDLRQICKVCFNAKKKTNKKKNFQGQEGSMQNLHANGQANQYSQFKIK